VEIIEIDPIRTLLDAGVVAVACGGGGVPVVARSDRLDGIDAVIDKDLASALLATTLGAKRLVILTDVDALYEKFGTDDQRAVRALTPNEAEALVPRLPAGSMGPKLEAVASFVRASAGEALITSAAALERALEGEAGTRICG
jgi:carbamate kinase